MYMWPIILYILTIHFYTFKEQYYHSMANTGVLPFVRGIDFSNNDFEVSIFNFIILFQITKWQNIKKKMYYREKLI